MEYFVNTSDILIQGTQRQPKCRKIPLGYRWGGGPAGFDFHISLVTIKPANSIQTPNNSLTPHLAWNVHHHYRTSRPLFYPPAVETPLQTVLPLCPVLITFLLLHCTGYLIELGVQIVKVVDHKRLRRRRKNRRAEFILPVV